MKFISTLIFCTLMFLAPARAANCPAENLIQSAGNAFMNAANAGTPQAFSSAAARFTDLRGLALFALGPYRRNLSPSMEGKYVARAKAFMGKFMADHANRFSGSAITITSCNPSGNGLIVGAKLTDGGSLTFRLRGTNRIEDVSVSGIWMAQTLRTKFTSVINNHGGDVNALMSYLGN
jgi:phospholipid transport system substrate-binding protein